MHAHTHIHTHTHTHTYTHTHTHTHTDLKAMVASKTSSICPGKHPYLLPCPLLPSYSTKTAWGMRTEKAVIQVVTKVVIKVEKKVEKEL